MMSKEEKNSINKKDLVGKVVKLDPKKSGMLVDSVNDYTFNFFDEGNDYREVTEDMDITVIERNIKNGILRVYDDGDDVTQDFGGPEKRDIRREPLVNNGITRPNKDDKEDKSLLNILKINDIGQIKKSVNSISDYSSLKRLKDFEKNGDNPCSQPRVDVIQCIEDRMEHVNGIEMEDEPQDKEEVTVK